MENRLEHRAIQLGLQEEATLKYSREWILSIEDISEFVAKQRQNLGEKNQESFLTPSESVYGVSDPKMVAFY
jgi:hypothetical protein